MSLSIPSYCMRINRRIFLTLSSNTAWTLLGINSQHCICYKGIHAHSLKDRRSVYLQHRQAQFRSQVCIGTGVATPLSVSGKQTCCLATPSHICNKWRHKGEQLSQLSQKVSKRPVYLPYGIHYKVVPSADVICGGFTLLWWRLKGREACESLFRY